MKDQTILATAQAAISDRQADIADRQNDMTAISQRAFVFAKDIRIDKVRNPVLGGQPNQFEDALWFSPIIENGGNTPTKDMRISAQAAIDPSRPEIEVKLPMNFGLGMKQSIDVSHMPDAGPPDPEKLLTENEELEGRGKPSHLIRTILGPHVSQSFGGFGITVEEAKRRLQEGGRWFILGAIHYNDRLNTPSYQKITKYCFSIGLSISETGEVQSTVGPCPHWNCADDECKGDKAAYNTETKGAVRPAMLQPTSISASISDRASYKSSLRDGSSEVAKRKADLILCGHLNRSLCPRITACASLELGRP